MSDLPTTLAEMQRDILQGDLSLNSYLQPSPIASRDKELKTDNKKMIPAVNELLKKINVCIETVNTFTSEFNAVNDEMYDEVMALGNMITQHCIEEKAEIEEMATQIIDLNDYILKQDKKIAELKNDIALLSENLIELKKNIAKGVKSMEFVEKIVLEKGQSKRMSLTAQELYDIEKQIKIYAYDASSKSYKHIENKQLMQTSSSSIYQFSVSPIEVKVNAETDQITVGYNKYYPLILYVFK